MYILYIYTYTKYTYDLDTLEICLVFTPALL